MKDRFFFLHIPKTAGRYMWSIIRQNFLPSRIGFWAPRDFHGLFQCPEPDNLDALSGHLHFNIDDIFTDGRPLFKWTILRDPVERVISQFLYNQGEFGLCIPLEMYLTSDATSPLADNVMTRMIGSSMSLKEVKCAVSREPETIDPSIGSFLAESIRKDNLDDCFKFAKYRLITEMNFGIKEYLLASAKALSSITGLTVPVNEDGECHYKYRKVANQNDIDIIISKNKYDISLYQEMKRVFEDRYSQFI